jgi:hypothetical protein
MDVDAQAVLNMSVIVFMVTTIDEEKIESDPPLLPFDVTDPKWRKELMESGKRSAQRYDAYREIVQLSFYKDRTPVHILNCGDPELDLGSMQLPPNVYFVDSEMAMMQRATEMILKYHSTSPEGYVYQPAIFTGWKIWSDIWPTLVNKALAHSVPFPNSLKTDPMKRWSTNQNLLDLSTIYSQGTSMNMRRLPALADCLRYWGNHPATNPDGFPRYATMDTIREQICENPQAACTSVAIYMQDMHDALERYYEGV